MANGNGWTPVRERIGIGDLGADATTSDLVRAINVLAQAVEEARGGVMAQEARHAKEAAAENAELKEEVKALKGSLAKIQTTLIGVLVAIIPLTATIALATR